MPEATAFFYFLCEKCGLEEPVAWYGPIVMNTQEQLQQAFRELEKGTFLKEQKRGKASGDQG